MKRFVEGVDRGQSTLFPECLDDWVDEDSPVRVIDVFVDELDLGALDFGGVDPKATGRPSYHPTIGSPYRERITFRDCSFNGPGTSPPSQTPTFREW